MNFQRDPYLRRVVLTDIFKRWIDNLTCRECTNEAPVRYDADNKPEADNVVRTAPLRDRLATIADALRCPALSTLRGFVVEVQ